MYSHSNKWKSVHVKEREERNAMNNARRRFCPKSSAWTHNFDLTSHKAEWETLRQGRFDEYAAYEEKCQEERVRNEITETTSFRAPMEGNYMGAPMFRSNNSAVLSQRTVFSPFYGVPNQPHGENVIPIDHSEGSMAPWPIRAEMKYEGDDRISTDRIHGRFLPAPRVAGNETVNWQHRPIIEPYLLDDFRPKHDPVDVFLRSNNVEELEISDEEGKELIGAELMAVLDPIDKL